MGSGGVCNTIVEVVLVYSDAVRERALGLLRQGLSTLEVGRRLSLSRMSVNRWAMLAGMTFRLGHYGGVVEGLEPGPVEPGWVDRCGRLTEAARVLIQTRKRDGRGDAAIAAELGVNRSTVWREVVRNSVDGQYRAGRAHTMTILRRARPKPVKLAPSGSLRAQIVARLNNKFSPQQISHDLRLQYPDDKAMRISHETIYQALYVQGNGTLRHELSVEKALRSGRTGRRPRSKLPGRGHRSWIGATAHLTDRPAEIADRAVPGHWEGDLVVGTGGTSALITLVERSTRFTLIRRLPLTHDAITVADTLVAMMGDLPASLRRSLTWDQGCEMANHATFTLATGCPVFFCDPHSPWQRGTNENTNGLIRDFYPKTTDFRSILDDDIAHTEYLLNIRPRRALDWRPPSHKLNHLLNVAPTT
jgi:IS30 family transposase